MRPPLLLPFLTALALAQGGRDPWERMRGMDADGDGKVSRAEFRGPEQLFARLDGDRDGFVTEQEAKARQGGRGGAGPGPQLFDSNGDGKVDAEEWQAFFEKADENGDEVLQQEELSAALRGERYRDPRRRWATRHPR
ncbi:MAG: hypothetical protein HC813_03205 [Planctomycetes bacterium]|nr:hypothetical protein [Planctomycetota bacterium]